MNQKIKNFYSAMGQRIMLVSAMLGAISSIGLLHSDQVLVLVGIFAALFILGAAFFGVGQLKERKLVRLRAEGTAYDADSIDYAPSFSPMRDYSIFRAYFSYTDHEGIVRTTKTRRYALRLGRSETQLTPLDEFKFSAKVYVNPVNPRDYGVDLYVED